MILRRLVLKNFRRYKDLEIEFPTGLIGIVGPNGAGKTTLLEAISFCLYGTEASRTKAKGIRRDGSDRNAPCAAELEFEIAGEAYRVRRSFKGTSDNHDAFLFRGRSSDPYARQTKGVHLAVRRLLGMDYRTFTRSLFSKQKEVNALSDATPEERRKAIRRVVGIDTIDHARASAASERRELEANVEGARRALASLPEKKDELAELGPALAAAKRSVAAKAKVTSSAADAVGATRSTLARLEVKRADDARLEKQRSGVEGDLRGTKKRERDLISELATLDLSRKELARLLPDEKRFREVEKLKESLDRASGAHSERVEVQRDLASLAKRIASAKKALEAASATLEELGEAKRESSVRGALRSAKARLKSVEKSLRSASERLAAIQPEADKVKRMLSTLNKLGREGECPTCLRPLGGSFEEITSHLSDERDAILGRVSIASDAVRKVTKQAKSEEASVRQLEKQLDLAIRKNRAAAEAKERVANRAKSLRELQSQVRAKQKRAKTLADVRYDAKQHSSITTELRKLDAIHSRVTRIRQDVGRIPGLRKSLTRTSKDLQAFELELGSIARQRKALRFDSAKHEAAKDAHSAAQKADKAAAVALADSKGEYTRCRESLRRLEREVSGLEKQGEQIATDEERIRYLARIESLFDEFRVELMGRVRPQIEDYSSLLLGQVTDGRYPRITLDADYAISIHDATGAHPIKRFSGGEEDLANLCLRIAISQVVSQRAVSDTSSLVVLDEVFGSQDAERRESILHALLRLQESFQQIILITHTEDLHDRIPHVLRVSEGADRDATVAWQ